MQNLLVEIDDPLASDVTFGYEESSESYVHLQFNNVPKNKISFIKDKSTAPSNNIVSQIELYVYMLIYMET